MKKNDLLLIGALLILCGIAAVFFFARTDIDADCPDLVCVKTGKAQKKGDVIACLPHKLLIEVK